MAKHKKHKDVKPPYMKPDVYGGTIPVFVSFERSGTEQCINPSDHGDDTTQCSTPTPDSGSDPMSNGS